MEAVSVDEEFVTIKTDAGGYRKIPVVYPYPSVEDVNEVIGHYRDGHACLDSGSNEVPDYAVGNAKMMLGILRVMANENIGVRR